MIYSRPPFGNIALSKLGLGTVQFGMDYGYTKRKSQREIQTILDGCLTCGINFLDTARGYGDSEEKIGHFLRASSNASFFIASKLSRITKEIACERRGLRSYIETSLRQSLAFLGIPKLNLLQLSQADLFVIENEDFWQVISELKSEGLFDYFGVSIYEPKEAEMLIREYSDLVKFLQIPYNVFDQRFAALSSLFAQSQIAVIGRSAYLKGIIPVAHKDIPPELEKIKPFKDKLTNLSKGVGLSVSELALLFAVRADFIHCTIVGVDSIRELKANVQVLENLRRMEPIDGELEELAIETPFLIDPRRWSQL